MKKLLLLAILSSVIFSKEINLDNLLKEYQDSESLYKKTNQENAGFLISYSREDLERMQAYSLRDVLKTIRMFNLVLTPIGTATLEKASTNNLNMNPIKLYIDNFEITSLMQSNPLELYIDMDLYFVDHIEVYQGGSSIRFGNEPGSMVIRLYSKNPCRENSKSFEASVDSLGSNNLRFIDAGKFNNYEYLGYGSIKFTKYKTYPLNGENLSRNFNNYQTHFKLAKKDNFDIDFDALYNQSDAFKAFGEKPSDANNIEKGYYYLSFTKYFKNQLKLSLSLSQEYKKADIKDKDGFATIYSDTSKIFTTDTNSKIYRLILEKKIIEDKNNLLFGSQFIRKSLDVHSYEIDGFSPNFDITRLDISMFYLEDLYNFNKNNTVSCSLKIDNYKNNVSSNDTEYSVRVAYIKRFNHNWKNKMFITRRYVYPNGMQTSFNMPVYELNTNLTSVTLKNIANELEYKKSNNKLLLGFSNMDIYNPIVFDYKNKIYKNVDINVYYNRYYIRDEYKFDLSNKFIIEYFKIDKDIYLSSGEGLLVQSFNQIGKINLYNELTYRNSYVLNNIKINAGYDWTMGITYPVNKNITLKVKGENLLDKAVESLIDTETLLTVPVYERRFIMTMEYTF